MKKMFLGLVFLVVSLTACPGAGPGNFSGALELPAGKVFNQDIGFAVGACFVVSGKCDSEHPNSKAIVINAKVNDSKVPFLISDLKSGGYFIIVFDQDKTPIGGLINAAEDFVLISPPKNDVKIIIAPSQLGGAVLR